MLLWCTVEYPTAHLIFLVYALAFSASDLWDILWYMYMTQKNFLVLISEHCKYFLAPWIMGICAQQKMMPLLLTEKSPSHIFSFSFLKIKNKNKKHTHYHINLRNIKLHCTVNNVIKLQIEAAHHFLQGVFYLNIQYVLYYTNMPAEGVSQCYHIWKNFPWTKLNGNSYCRFFLHIKEKLYM